MSGKGAEKVSGKGNRKKVPGLFSPSFPYAVIHFPEMDGDVIQVRVIYHQRRHSGYWKDRVEGPAPRYRCMPAAA